MTRIFKGSKKATVLTLLVVGMLIVVAQLVQIFDKEPEPVLPPRPVKTITIAENQGSFTRTYPGVVRSSQIADLSFEVAGELVELLHGEGDVVTQGTLLARLDATGYENRLAASRAQYNEAKSNLERAQSLYQQELISQVEMETRQASFDVALAELNISQKLVDDTYLYAPFDGRLSARYVERFEKVQVGTVIMSLENQENIDVVINLPENTVRNIDQYKINAFAVFPAREEEHYPLSLKEFSTNPDVQTRTYRVTLNMPMPQGFSVVSGMSIQVILNATPLKEPSQGEQTFILPQSALIADSEGFTVVWLVQEDRTVVPRRVETGNLKDGSVEILSGIQEGDVVVIAGVSQLIEGQVVRFYEG